MKYVNARPDPIAFFIAFSGDGSMKILFEQRWFGSFLGKRGLSSIIILFLQTLVMGPLWAAQERDTQHNTGNKDTIEIRLPNGLYMYKATYGRKELSPLMVIENGKLIDPYYLVKKSGLQKFTNDYVSGKQFDAYIGSEKLGQLNDMRLEKADTCLSPYFLQDIRGGGQYEGKQFPINEKENSQWGRRGTIYNATRLMAAPPLFSDSKKTEFLPITEADRKIMVEAVRKTLLTNAFAEAGKYLPKKWGTVKGEGQGSALVAAEATDLDNNGKKDFVGIYELEVKYAESPYAALTMHLLFVLWDTGKVEQIRLGFGIPAFIIVGMLDIDQNGTQELIFQSWIGSPSPGGDPGRQIEIVRHGDDGWKRVYQSKRICDGTFSVYFDY